MLKRSTEVHQPTHVRPNFICKCCCGHHIKDLRYFDLWKNICERKSVSFSDKKMYSKYIISFHKIMNNFPFSQPTAEQGLVWVWAQGLPWAMVVVYWEGLSCINPSATSIHSKAIEGMQMVSEGTYSYYPIDKVWSLLWIWCSDAGNSPLGKGSFRRTIQPVFFLGVYVNNTMCMF